MNPYDQMMQAAKAAGVPIMVFGGGMPNQAPPPPAPPSPFPAPPPPAPQGFPAPSYPPSFGGGASSFPMPSAPPMNGVHGMGGFPSMSPGLPPGSAPAPAAPVDDTRLRTVVAQNDALQEEVAQLRAKLGGTAKEAAELHAKLIEAHARLASTAAINGAHPQLTELQARIANAESAARGIANERDALNAKVRELQELIATRPAGGAPAPGAAPVATGTQPPPEANFDAYPINVLGLEDKLVRAINKAAGAEVKSVGALWATFKAGKIKAKTQEQPDGVFTKDQVILIADRLLGRVPPSIPAEGTAPAASSPTAPAAAPGVPAGITDRMWLERIESAQKKEKKAAECKADLDRMVQEQTRLRAGEQTPDTKEALEKLAKAIHDQDKMLGLFEGQVLALLWACGFDPKQIGKGKTVDDVLKGAGLVHLLSAGATPAAK